VYMGVRFCHSDLDGEVLDPLVGARELPVEGAHDGEQRRHHRAQAAGEGQALDPVGKGLRTAGRDAVAVLAEQDSDERDIRRILGRNVAFARLSRANRRFIEEEIPHIASLMCNDLDSLLEHAEVLVIGHTGPDAVRALSTLRPAQKVIDLTRGAARREDPPPSPSPGLAAR
jgi:hypothetical protein